ncbi:MAG: VOC family protein [Oscillospiraceae bacterium]|nr:VOC family protein [Oscillospiraceae bacterium]
MIKSILGISFDCPNANELADFYMNISGWTREELSGDEWAGLRTPEGILLVFQTVEDYTPPVWPWENGKQQQMAHIDFFVDNLQEVEKLALYHGAKKSEIQFFDTSTVMFDPAGHPFCLSTVKE